ncbi:aminotransferase class V-fold PLP-dependent enzyme [Pseudooceanicola sp.]|uniref:pyridoxal-phosphate-dependent aminotransferase family protein n=1 Tax=Pseudooceanicola sp. TaxID=1914328 RepID=UPI00260D89B3|nr:aminotransferase class V-fold PLP-dependent enzyme [Pseudooceanicola sp.]MDF1856242.1 aminotransferase class V-fold PLP-dependent enzyme [Pseudooceanicola sp.]
MSLAAGRPYLAIPGPSVMPDPVLQAMHTPSPNIYEGEIVDLMASVSADLKRVARTEHQVAMYMANGHGAWEAALANVLRSGDKVLVAVTGRFGHGWADMATGLGAEIEILDFGLKSPVDPDRVEAALRADTDHRIRAVLFSHVDTSTSIRNDPRLLRAALDAAGHPALLLADCIASLACDRFEMDAWGVDVAVTGSQKGLMVPPGLGFVFFNDKAQALAVGRNGVSRYWDWTARANPVAGYQYFGGTSATHHVYGLRKALDMIHDEGIESVWARHASLARTIWAACDAWGAGGAMRMNVADPALRSHAVTALGLGDDNGTRLRQWCERETGLTLGIGLGMVPDGDPRAHGYFRIGHMGHVNGHMIMGLLGAIEAGMLALDIPFGPGALSAAAAVIAKG